MCDHWRKLHHLCTRADCSFGFARYPLNPLNPLAAKLGSLLQKRRPASALPFGPWFDAWHGQHWPFSVGVFGKSWSLVCSIWKINDAMHFDGRNVEQVTETSAPCSIHAIVSRLFCFCWHLLISMFNFLFFNFFCARNVWGANVHISSASLTWKMTFKQFRWFTVKSQTQWVSQITAPVTQFDALIKLKHASCYYFDLASMFPLSIFHHFPCFLFFCMFLYGFRAECIKQPEFYSGLRVENNLRCEPTTLNFPWEIPLRWAKVNLLKLCCSKAVGPIFSKMLFSCFVEVQLGEL